MYWYFKVLKNYANFSGRARRREYWMFILTNLIIYIILGILAAIYGVVFGVIIGVYTVAMIMPYYAVAVRRLHDVGYDESWIYIKSSWFFELMCEDGTPCPNKYGDCPKDISKYSGAPFSEIDYQKALGVKIDQDE
jgi:uncharacterized membrane protein YhaH (DUF805 family)